jgi:uncharacterized protein (TIGR03067 family)
MMAKEHYDTRWPHGRSQLTAVEMFHPGMTTDRRYAMKALLKSMCSRAILWPAIATAALAASNGITAQEKDDAKAIQGTWEAVAGELGGVKQPEDSLPIHQITLKGGKYDRKKSPTPDKGSYKVDPGKKPRAIDLTTTEGPGKGVTVFAIYELKGDELRVCYDLQGETRPTEFKTKKGTSLHLVTYKRAK